MENSPNLNLPYIMPAQAQKHITHNEAIAQLDKIIHLTVKDAALNTAPPTPQANDSYIVATSPTGVWAQNVNDIATFIDNDWQFLSPNTGWLCWVDDVDQLLVWDGINWAQNLSQEFENLPKLGINSSADATNRLSINAPATLLNHEGAGHQLKINKNANSDTASLLFQTGFSGRAEMGLTGDNNFHIKVSDDGQNWHNALNIDAQSGLITDAALRSGTITINNDSASTINTPHASGLVCIVINNDVSPQLSHSGVFAYASGASLALQELCGGGDLNTLGTATLSGTTGATGKSSIAVANGQLTLENRSGASQTYSYTYIG